MSRVKGAPWDFKANLGDDVHDGGIPDRAGARPPDPPIEIPSRINVRRMYIRRVDVEKYGPTIGCPGCHKVSRGTVPSCIAATHNDECRERMERLMMQDPVGADRVVRTRTRHEEALAKHVGELDEREKKLARHSHHTQEDTLDQSSSSSSSRSGQIEQTATRSTGRKATMMCTSKTQT